MNAPSDEHSQLMMLCQGEGATPDRIRSGTPFMKDLMATWDTVHYLYGGDGSRWAEASHALLDCLTKRAISHRASMSFGRIARASLALDGQVGSLQSRLATLSTELDELGSDRRTQAARRSVAMARLAVMLRATTRYPCRSEQGSNNNDESAAIYAFARLVVEQLIAVLQGHSETDEAERIAYLREFFELLPEADAVLDELRPGSGHEERWRLLFESVLRQIIGGRSGEDDDIREDALQILTETSRNDGFLDAHGEIFYAETLDAVAAHITIIEHELRWREVISPGDAASAVAGTDVYL